MIIIKYPYPKNIGLEDINRVVQNVRSQLEDEVIAIPNDFEMLLDCSTDELYWMIDKIQEAIRKKELINEM